MSSIRAPFVQEFGEDAAASIEKAANMHQGGFTNRGSDPFKWALLVAIGWECISSDNYAGYHKIKHSFWPRIDQWIIDCADLGSHDGDSDALSMAVGAYDRYMKKPVAK